MQTHRCACMLPVALPVPYVARHVLTPVQQPGSFSSGASVYLISSGLLPECSLVCKTARGRTPHCAGVTATGLQGYIAQANNSITRCLISYLNSGVNIMEL